MSNVKSTKKMAVSPTNSKKQKKKRLVQNTYDLAQFKRLIGKGLITQLKCATAVFDTELKNKILSKTIKSIALTGIVSNGVVYVFEGVDRLLALNAVSYAEIKKHDLEIDVIVNQYFNLSLNDLTNYH
jgi:hypothetical protein